MFFTTESTELHGGLCAAIKVDRESGPGLPESTYAHCIARELCYSVLSMFCGEYMIGFVKRITEDEGMVVAARVKPKTNWG